MLFLAAVQHGISEATALKPAVRGGLSEEMLIFHIVLMTCVSSSFPNRAATLFLYQSLYQ